MLVNDRMKKRKVSHSDEKLNEYFLCWSLFKFMSLVLFLNKKLLFPGFTGKNLGELSHAVVDKTKLLSGPSDDFLIG